MPLPQPVQEKLDELNQIVEQYPIKIPVEIAAKFLGWDKSCLRRSVDQGKAPFAVGCDNGKYGNRSACIPTATFYFWYTNSIVV